MSCQLKHAATTVIVREKSTSLSEPVSIEFSIKFTKDTLKSWFKNTTKSNFLELNDIEKQLFVNENPTIPSRTICCICGFLLDIESASGHEVNKKTWYNFVVEKEHLFIRNIYSKEELGEMKDISDISDYHEKFKIFIKIVMLLGKKFGNYRMEEKHLLEEFFHYDLDDKFSHFGKLRDAIDEFKVVRKFGKCNYIDKIIGFVDVNIMNFEKTGEVNPLIFSAICIDNAKGLIYKKQTYITLA